MSSIGGRTVTTFGLMMDAGTSRPVVETFGKEAVDGLGMHVLAKKPRTVEGPTRTDVADKAAADTEIAAFYAFIGTAVTIVDQFAKTWSTVKVEECTAVPSLNLTGGYTVIAQWKVSTA
jgi:hypothetical protein